jgi:hypothetical protein
MLWGEIMPMPELNVAALWYRRAIAYVPGYVKARVHLAEIYASQDRTGDAEALLLPALSSRDPEVPWHLGDVLVAQERLEEAKIQLDAARFGFEELLQRHLLAGARTRASERRKPADTPRYQGGARNRGECR